MTGLRNVAGLPAYYLAATAARTGDEMVAIAVVLLVLDRTGSAPLAGAVVAAYTLPTVLSGPLLGAWLDRTRFRRAALAANQLLLALVMLALIATVGTAPGWVPIGLAALAGATLPMTSGGFTSLLPRFVPAGLLPRAHAIEGVSFSASAILGPATAATVAVVASPALALATIAGFATLSLLALTGLPRATSRSARSDHPERTGFASSVRAGLTHLIRTAPLGSVTAATSVAFVGVGMLAVALPVHTERLVGDAGLVGYLWASFEVGAVVTALAWGRWHARWRPERVVLATLLGYGAVLLSWPAAGSYGVLLALAMLAGLAQGAGMPALFTSRQRYTPPELYSQISTTGASLKLSSFALGAGLAGSVLPQLGAPAVLLLAAGLPLLGAAIGALLLRRPRSGPEHRRGYRDPLPTRKRRQAAPGSGRGR